MRLLLLIIALVSLVCGIRGPSKALVAMFVRVQHRLENSHYAAMQHGAMHQMQNPNIGQRALAAVIDERRLTNAGAIDTESLTCRPGTGSTSSWLNCILNEGHQISPRTWMEALVYMRDVLHAEVKVAACQNPTFDEEDYGIQGLLHRDFHVLTHPNPSQISRPLCWRACLGNRCDPWSSIGQQGVGLVIFGYQN